MASAATVSARALSVGAKDAEIDVCGSACEPGRKIDRSDRHMFILSFYCSNLPPSRFFKAALAASGDQNL
jgi:hypothetical protein